jgi:hypothetical protein
VDAIEQDARERSHLLEGMVRTDDADAVAFWSSLGWNPVGAGHRTSWVRGIHAPTGMTGEQR